MSFARVNGTLLHYRMAGPEDAPSLVFANSLGTDHRIWDGVIARLGKSHHCLSYDKRGHGPSDSPGGAYELNHHLDDLEGLLDRLGISGSVLIGVSVGGLIAQGLALRAPDRLAGLVLCNTAPRIGDRQAWDLRIGTVRDHGMAAIADTTMERWFSPGFRRERPDELAGWRNLLLRTDPAGYASTCATLRDTDLTQAIAGIGLPTLVVAGEADLATPVDLVRGCAQAIPGARFAVLPGAGHIPSIEQPATLSELIIEFLKEIGHG